MRDGNAYQFRNEKSIATIVDNAANFITLIDATDYNLTKIDVHEMETLFAISNLRAELQRLIQVGREIRRANRP